MYLFVLSNNIVVLGSLHLADFDSFPQKIKDEVNTAEILFVESTTMVDDSARIEFFNKIDGVKTVDSYTIKLPSAVQGEIEQHLTARNFPLRINDLTLNGLAMVIYAMKNSNRCDHQLETLFENNNKPIFCLEEAHDNEAVQEYIMKCMLQDPIDMMYAGYHNDSTDLSKKYSVQAIEQEFFINESYNHIDRNKNWFKRFDQYNLANYQTSKTMICVGVAHLFGKNGVLNYFLKNGVEIERVYDFASDSFIPCDEASFLPDLAFEQTEIPAQIPIEQQDYIDDQNNPSSVHPKVTFASGMNMLSFAVKASMIEVQESSLKIEGNGALIGPGKLIFTGESVEFDYPSILHDVEITLTGNQVEIDILPIIFT